VRCCLTRRLVFVEMLAVGEMQHPAGRVPVGTSSVHDRDLARRAGPMRERRGERTALPSLHSAHHALRHPPGETESTGTPEGSHQVSPTRRDAVRRATSVTSVARQVSGQIGRAAPATNAATMYVACRSRLWRARS
jgi:hypothetical protein